MLHVTLLSVDGSNSAIAGGVAGALLAVLALLILIVVILVIFIVRRRNQRLKETNNQGMLL